MSSSYRVQWYIPNQVVISQYWGDVSLKDVTAGIEESNILLESTQNQSVHHILDMRALGKMLPLRDIPAVMKKVDIGTGKGWMIVMTNGNQLMRFSASIAQQLLGLKSRLVATPEEANAALRHADDTLDWNQADFNVWETATNPAGQATERAYSSNGALKS